MSKFPVSEGRQKFLSIHKMCENGTHETGNHEHASKICMIHFQFCLLFKLFQNLESKYILSILNCEAQGKGRAKGRPRKVTERSFIDGGWWMVDILSLMLYTKFGCHQR